MKKIDFENEIMMEIGKIEPKTIKPIGMNLNAFALIIFGLFGLFILLGALSGVNWNGFNFSIGSIELITNDTALIYSLFVSAMIVIGLSVSTAIFNLFPNLSR